MRRACLIFVVALWPGGSSSGAQADSASPPARDLPDIQKAGVLRHLGVPYANFVTGSGDGMDVELIAQFARSLNLRYEYVKADWASLIPDLIGRRVRPKGSDVIVLEPTPVRGDLVANGLTVLEWRAKAVDFSAPTFPTQVWLVARADSTIRPIKPTGNVEKDIALVKGLLKGRTVLGKSNTCLEPSLYHLEATGATIKLFAGGLNELAPAVIKGEAEATILDVPDALIALEKWPGRLKIIGPICRPQTMAVGFPKTSPELRRAFDVFLEKSRKDGTYAKLVRKYYPNVFLYYPDFFRNGSQKH